MGPTIDAVNRRRKLLEAGQHGALVSALIVVTIIFTSMSPYFLTLSNLSVIFLQVSVGGIIAVPAAMLLLSGYVDLSVGSVAVLSAVLFGRMAAGGMNVWIAVLLALAAGLVFGALQGWLISYLTFSPIVVTLGGLAAARGLARLINGSDTKSGFSDSFAYLGNGKLVGIPIPVYIFAVVFLVGGYIWYLGPWVRHMKAMGSNAEATRSLGVNIRLVPTLLYAASGLMAALGGLIITSQLDSASTTIGQQLELDVLTAVLLGGVAFAGGRGSLVGVLLGVVFIGVLRNGLLIANTNPFLYGVIIGCALVAAAGLEVLYKQLDRVKVSEVDDNGK